MESRPATAPARRRRHRVVLGVAGVLAATLVAGCGLRLETPPPAEPVPDTVEIVRRTAVSDALYVAERAEAAIETLDGRRPRLTAELERVAAASRLQADELGGVYDSGLESDDGTTATPQASPTQVDVSAMDVVEALADASGRSRIAAGTTADGPLARLLASVGASQAVSTRRVAEYTDADLPAPATPVVPEPDPAAVPPDDEDDDAPDSTDAEPSGATPTVSEDAGAAADDEADDDADAEPGVLSTVPDSDAPAIVPRGLTAADLRALVESEDSAGYALRLRSALASGDERDRLGARADVHDARAHAWALVSGTSGTEQDPRQVAYAVPREEDDEALVRTVEDNLATNYATLVGTTAPDTRTVLVDLLVEAAVTLDAWGAEPAAFPGLPEQGED